MFIPDLGVNMVKHNEYIGVVSPFDLLSTSLKREVLFFDKIAIPNILENNHLNSKISSCPIRSIEYLIDLNIIIDPIKDYIGEEEYLRKIGKEAHNLRIKEIQNWSDKLKSEVESPIEVYPTSDISSLVENLPKNIATHIKRFGDQLAYSIGVPLYQFASSVKRLNDQLDYDRRGIAIDLQKKFSINAYPVYTQEILLVDEFDVGHNDVIDLVIDQLPEPDYECVSWEKIIDFRSDPETIRLRKYLRKWISDTARSNLKGNEIVEQIEYYCAKYEEHIDVYKMGIRHGIIKALLMVSAEMLEGLVTLKPTKTVNALFSHKKRKVKLLEEEIKAPGRDLAYILKCKDEFSG